MTYVEAVRKGLKVGRRGHVRGFYVVKLEDSNEFDLRRHIDEDSPHYTIIAEHNPFTGRMVSALGLLGLLAHGVPAASARKLVQG